MNLISSGPLRRVLCRALAYLCVLVLAFYATPITVAAQGSGDSGLLQPGASGEDGAEGDLQPGASEDDGAEELILAISYPPYTLSNGFLAVQKGEEYFLPLVELARLFDFYIEADTPRVRYHGYFRDEQSSYAIDLAKNEMESEGKTSPLPSGSVLTDPLGDGGDDIYVRLDILNRIWPVDLSVDLSTLTMLVKTEEKLAFELKLEREETRALALARKNLIPSALRKDLPFQANPYKFAGLPAVDLDTEYRWDHEKKVLTGRTSFAGVQDLLWASADYSGTVSYEEGRFHQPDAIRLRLTREAFGDDTLPLGAKIAEGGDVSIQHRSLVDGGSNGRGVRVSSYPGLRESEFDRITVEGTGIAGWEVELYRNEILEAFTTIDETGEYRFEDVPLTVGNNQIRVVLYGPQGQVQERIENYDVNGGMSRPGETNYTLGLVDSDRPFVMLAGSDRTTPRGIAGNAFVAHGINEKLTVFGSASQVPTPTEGDKTYLSAGAMAAFLNSFGQAELFKETNGGHALDLRFATKLLGVRLNLQSAFFRNYSSPDAGFGAGAKTYEGEVRANTNLKTPLGPIGLQLTGNHQETKNGLPSSTVNFQQSLGLSGIRFTHSTNSRFDNYIHTSSTGRLSATVRIQRWQMRSEFDYNIHPNWELSSGGGEIRYRKDSFSAAVNAQHNFLTLDRSAGFQLGYDFGKVLGSMDFNWVKEGGYNVTLRASTSLGPYGPNGSYIVDSKKLSRLAPAAGHVFLDHDGDHVFGEGDEPLPEAQILVDGRSSGEEADENGYTVSRNGSPGKVSNVEINKSSLIDPYYQPGLPGYSTVTRIGSMPQFEFPVIETGSIDGTVSRESDSPISGMKLELVNEGGEVVMTTETAYDGFYTFEFVPPGTYTVRADPSYGVNVPPETVTVASEDLFAYGIDLQLLEQAEDAEAADEVEEGDEPAATDDAVAE